MSGTRKIVAKVPYEVDRYVAGRVKADRQDWEDRLRARRLERAHLELRGAAAAAARVEDEELREQLQLAGLQFDTSGALMTWGVRAELAARGWDRPWPRAPREARMRGRWPGSQDGGWPATVQAYLPADLVDTVIDACWAVSVDAIEEVRAWREDHPDVLTRNVPAAKADSELYREYERLAAPVTPPGTIWRAGIARALAHRPFPPRREDEPDE